MSTHARHLLFVLAVLTNLAGCTAPPVAMNGTAQRRMLAMLMPSRIEIVEPFTRVKSFGGDNTLDGIELLLQAVNSLDNPGLMIVGDVNVELYEHVPASADNRGALLEHWDIELSTVKHQRTHWNQLTQMYEFKLGVTPSQIPNKGNYVLVVTYNSPLGDHLLDSCVLRYRAGTNPLGGPRARVPRISGG